MKTLVFDTDTYDVIYESMLLGTYSNSQLITALKIFDKLDSIGKLRSGVEGEQGLRNITSVPSTLKFEDAEFELLKASFESVRWGGRGARQAANTYKWLTNISST